MRKIWTLAVAVLCLGAVLVVPGRRDAGAAVTPLAVDYGITGASDLAAWGGFTLDPAPMVSRDTETVVFLGFRGDVARLEARATAVSDPASPSYGDYRSVAETAAAFNATDQQITAAVDWFRTRGVTLTVDATRTFASASMSIAVLEALTQATYGTYTVAEVPQLGFVVSPATTVTTIVPALEASIDRVSGAVFVVPPDRGTASVSPPRPAAVLPASAVEPIVNDGGTPWRTGTQTDSCAGASSQVGFGRPIGLSPGQLRSAYGIDELWKRGFDGRGVRIAVVDYAPYLHSDIDAWRDCFGLQGTPITDHVLGPLLDDSFQSLESTLDLQAVVSFAPHADRIDWLGVPAPAPTMIGSLLQLLAPAFDVANTGGLAPDVVTVSFYACEAEIVATDPASRVSASLYDRMVATAAASGIGTFVATGDVGSTGCFPVTNDVTASYPSTSRWVTAVGGTNVTLDANNHIVSAGAWNDTRMFLPTPAVNSQEYSNSGGGGLSVISARQPWQPRVGDGRARPVPDVSAFADVYPGAFLHFRGEWSVVGGTSIATPLLATSTALQSSARAARGQPRLGFVAPLFHSLAANGGTRVAGVDVIADVVLGTIDAHGVGVYAATPGFDLATGLGWVRQDALYTALLPVEPRPVDPPAVDPIVPRFTG